MGQTHGEIVRVFEVCVVPEHEAGQEHQTGLGDAGVGAELQSEDPPLGVEAVLQLAPRHGQGVGSAEGRGGGGHGRALARPQHAKVASVPVTPAQGKSGKLTKIFFLPTEIFFSPRERVFVCHVHDPVALLRAPVLGLAGVRHADPELGEELAAAQPPHLQVLLKYFSMKIFL